MADAAAAFEAIVLAHPADSATRPSTTSASRREVTLREAMAAAADRDRIASEYASGYAIVFDVRVAAADRRA